MSATKNFLYELEEFVWLIEFAPITFEQRGKARQLMRNWFVDKFGGVTHDYVPADLFDTAYELVDEMGGQDWATGKQAERLLAWVA